MSKIRRASAMVPTPKTYVKSVLSKVGLACGAIKTPYTSTPYWAHATMEFALQTLALPYVYISYGHSELESLRCVSYSYNLL